ncbi:RDD family protein [Streptomyces sp. NPDC046994]|uniref:RDD family protein n=1 Tax=Streptomyces sp. NPDC046994 TaxID=3155735 RepID=UPI003457265B
MTTPPHPGTPPAAGFTPQYPQYQALPWYQSPSPHNPYTQAQIPWHSVGPNLQQLPRYAPWWRRGVAFVLDLTINFGPIVALSAIGTAIDGRTGGEAAGTILGWVGVLAMLSAVVYQVIREGQTGQTLGKSALGIRSVRADDGRPLGVGRALGRRLLQLLNNVLLGLGWWWALWDDRAQTFADKIVGAVVIRVEAPLAPPSRFHQ